MSDQLILPALLRRESRSLLQYVHESFPWTGVKDLQTRSLVLSAAETENDLLAQLGRLMQNRHIPLPALGAYPISFTSMNYVSLSYLIPRLIAAERQSLADLDRDLPKIQDEQIRGVLESLRELKRHHVAERESLTQATKAA